MNAKEIRKWLRITSSKYRHRKADAEGTELYDLLHCLGDMWELFAVIDSKEKQIRDMQKRIDQQDKVLNSLEFHNKLSAQMIIDGLKKQIAAGHGEIDKWKRRAEMYAEQNAAGVEILERCYTDWIPPEFSEEIEAWLKENKHE